MRDIYQAASRVLVWLGMADKDSDQAMWLVNSISETNSSPNEDDNEAWDALVKLCQRTW
ncbi:hypothetical protein BCR34DRAFT_572335 [Clohesyomyces aquaticus]|uniref:Heterokaryon incompatibility domain-containing protein n=1 Tax=Clohesyomyces aquaticus TaxID=1231657 RepID=A0A1Y1Z492_9PLEO|nr:hypothetical protein BCR34DRAFT_572335 [Clohesyomyces aquaticus]